MTAQSSERTIVVFGGTGFLGRRVVHQLRERGFIIRIASRHPARSRDVFGAGDPDLLAVAADIHDERSIVDAIHGAHGVVNAVSLYVEHGSVTFQTVHVTAAARLARLSRESRVQQLVHLSGIGADAASPSPYIRSRAEGEQEVREAFADATLIRPAIMFGPGDAFLNAILRLLRRLPAYPMFGNGTTRLQPVHVEDVASAIACALSRDVRGATIECGGPRVYTYRELLATIAQAADLTPRLVPVPFAAWRLLARMAEALPNPPVTRNQVELMEIDSVVSRGAFGLTQLGVEPRTVEQTLQELVASRRHGRRDAFTL